MDDWRTEPDLKVGCEVLVNWQKLPTCCTWRQGSVSLCEQLINHGSMGHTKKIFSPTSITKLNHTASVLTTLSRFSPPRSANVPSAHFTSLLAVTGWVITQIQFACEPLCCLLSSCVFLLTHKKQSLFDLWHVTSAFLLILPALVAGGATSGQDATLTEGNRKWSHSSLSRS